MFARDSKINSVFQTKTPFFNQIPDRDSLDSSISFREVQYLSGIHRSCLRLQKIRVTLFRSINTSDQRKRVCGNELGQMPDAHQRFSAMFKQHVPQCRRKIKMCMGGKFLPSVVFPAVFLVDLALHDQVGIPVLPAVAMGVITSDVYQRRLL